MSGPGILLYDGDCAFCTTSATWIRDHARTVPGDEVRPWRPADTEAYGVTPAQAEREIHYVSPTGAVLGGSLAIFAWWQRCGAPWKQLGLLLSLPVARQLSAVGYRQIAAHRHLLPGATDACRMEPTDRASSGATPAPAPRLRIPTAAASVRIDPGA